MPSRLSPDSDAWFGDRLPMMIDSAERGRADPESACQRRGALVAASSRGRPVRFSVSASALPSCTDPFVEFVEVDRACEHQQTSGDELMAVPSSAGEPGSSDNPAFGSDVISALGSFGQVVDERLKFRALGGEQRLAGLPGGDCPFGDWGESWGANVAAPLGYDRRMITDPDAVRILCFGDSNTHGTPADDPDYVRLQADRRWTGVFQRLLGVGYDVIEEGLNGRTTDVDYEDRPGCNGRSYFVPCLLSHHPLDVIVVMLGSNDLKSCFDRTPTAIAEALHGYVDDIAGNVTDRRGRVPVTVLVSPIWIIDTAPRFQEVTGENFDPANIAARSRELAIAIRRVAQERGVLYADAAQVAHAGDDGHHLTLDSHDRLAELFASMILPAL